MPKSQTADTLAFAPATLRTRHDGWSAQRQRDFIAALADSGCITLACRAVGVSPQSAYRLRRHPKGKPFALAWDAALRCASVRLVSIAYERAIEGTRKQYWRDGKLIGETVNPSDALLMFLLTKSDPNRFGSQADRLPMFPDPAGDARAAIPRLIGALGDVDLPADGLLAGDA